MREKLGLGDGKAAGVGVGRWLLAPSSPLSGWVLGEVVYLRFLICKLGRIKYLFPRVVTRTNEQP